MTPRLLWMAAVAAAVVGTVLVFGSVTSRGLFMPGVVLIDVGLLLALVAALVPERAPGTTAAP